MAGKPKKQNGWGGKRDNQTGRPPKPVEEKDFASMFKDSVIRAIANLEEKHGVGYLEQAFGMMYEEKVQSAVKASLLKTYSEIFRVSESKQDITVTEKGPKIGLPPIAGVDPALKIVGGKQ